MDIAKKFGISRGPVREALKTLAFEDLIDYTPNKGCSVSTLSPTDAYEIFYMRGSFEKIALTRSMGMLTDEAIDKMQTALDLMRQANDDTSLSTVVAADELFHQQIVELGGMSRLTKMWKMLSPLNGAMFLTVRRAKKLGEDIFNEPSPNPYVTRSKTSYETHRMILDVLMKEELNESLLCLDAHYARVGESICRVHLREADRQKNQR